MDPTEAAKILSAGGVQAVLAVILVTVSVATWKLASALIKSFEDRIAENKVQLKQSSDDSRLITDALKDMKSTMDLALAALKGKS